VAPVNTIKPVILGTPIAGGMLNASTGTWSGTPPISVAFQWKQCNPGCIDIAGARGPTLILAGTTVGARIQVVVSATNSAGVGKAGSGEVGPVAPAAQQVKAALGKVLTSNGGARRIAALLRSGGYLATFAAPSAGRLTVSWELVPPGARPTRAKPRIVLVANGAATAVKAGAKRIRIRLTARGRALLAHARRLSLIASGRFTPAGGAPTVVFKPLTLQR
jgi:hypothetical protein